jgi:hypothetical protein
MDSFLSLFTAINRGVNEKVALTTCNSFTQAQTEARQKANGKLRWLVYFCLFTFAFLLTAIVWEASAD